MSNNQYLDDEQSEIIANEKRYSKDARYKRAIDALNMRKMLLILFVLTVALIGNIYSDLYCKCPECAHLINLNDEAGRIFPDTWICPNRKCGYENYEGIEYCALCGTKRPKR